MRYNYPVTAQEMLVELNSLQEALIKLIGYDANAFDNKEEIVGDIGDLEKQLDTQQFKFLNTRLYATDAMYASVYRSSLINYLIRRSKHA